MKEELISYAETLQTDYVFEIRPCEDSIGFVRRVPFGVRGVRTIGIAYKLDPADDFTTACKTIRGLIEQSLYQFDDQFYIDRGNGVPLVSDSIVDWYNPVTGLIETRRLDSIDWLTEV